MQFFDVARTNRKRPLENSRVHAQGVLKTRLAILMRAIQHEAQQKNLAIQVLVYRERCTFTGPSIVMKLGSCDMKKN